MSRELIDDLIDKPFNELTEEEAQYVIDWKAESKLKELQAQDSYIKRNEAIIAEAETYRALADNALKTLDEIKSAALNFYKAQ